MKITELRKQMQYSSGYDVSIKLKNNKCISGHCFGYTSEFDSDDKIAEIDLKINDYLGLITISENEIEEMAIIV